MSNALALAGVRHEVAPASEDNVLMVLDEIQRRLDTIATVADAKEVSDQAAAFLGYAKRARHCLVVQNRCAYVKIMAERRAGELVHSMEKLKGRPGKAYQGERLSDLGVDYNQSHRWRTLAKVPAESFAQLRSECDKQNCEFTSAYVWRALKWLLSADDYTKAKEPWSNWGDRPYDKEVFDAINFVNRHVASFLKPDGEADEMMNVVVRDRSYLFDHDAERLRDLLLAARERVERRLNDVQLMLDGRPPAPFEKDQGLLAFIKSK